MEASKGRTAQMNLGPMFWTPDLERKFNQLREAGLILLVETDSEIPMRFHSQLTWNELDVWVNELG